MPAQENLRGMLDISEDEECADNNASLEQRAKYGVADGTATQMFEDYNPEEPQINVKPKPPHGFYEKRNAQTCNMNRNDKRFTFDRERKESSPDHRRSFCQMPERRYMNPEHDPNYAQMDGMPRNYARGMYLEEYREREYAGPVRYQMAPDEMCMYRQPAYTRYPTREEADEYSRWERGHGDFRETRKNKFSPYETRELGSYSRESVSNARYERTKSVFNWKQKKYLHCADTDFTMNKPVPCGALTIMTKGVMHHMKTL